MNKHKKNLKSNSGFSLIEIMIAVGILGIVGAGITSLVLSGNKAQKNIELKQDSQTLMNEIQMIIAGTSCMADISPLASTPIPASGVADTLATINLPGGTPISEGGKYGVGGLEVDVLKFSVGNASGTTVTRADPVTNVVKNYRQHPITLKVRTGKSDTASVSSSGPSQYAERLFNFLILVDPTDNSVDYCSMDSGAMAQDACSDMMAGQYNSDAVSPKCLMNSLHLGVTFPANATANASLLTTAAGDLILAPANGRNFYLRNKASGADPLRFDMSTNPGGLLALVGNPAATTTLQVDGSITATGTITASSDLRLKKNIQPITDALYKVSQLQGVQFYFNSDLQNQFPQIGLIAQDAAKVVPEIVRVDKNGYYSVAYANSTALLIEAIKQQQQQIEELKQEIKKLQKQK